MTEPADNIPFVTMRLTSEGLQIQSNLKDKMLLLGLIETGKFVLMRPDAPAIAPATGFLRHLRGNGR